jgi:flagellar basal body rod protein FlgG
MDGMNWAANSMAAAQARLDVATTNLANAHVAGYREQLFTAACTAHGITYSATTEKTNNAHGHLPATDSAHEMVAVLEAQRNFETAQKVALSLDAVRAKDVSDVARAAQ